MFHKNNTKSVFRLKKLPSLAAYWVLGPGLLQKQNTAKGLKNAFEDFYGWAGHINAVVLLGKI